MAFDDDSPTIACPHCGHTIYAQARFCRRCGSATNSTPLTCSKCGSAAEAADALFCSKCGAALASSAPDSETRPLTVATPVRRSALVEPLPMSSLSPSPIHNLWLWAFGLAIVAAGVFAATRTDNVAGWLHVRSAQQARVNQKGPGSMRTAVQSFYNAINHRDFQRAYSLMSQSFRASKPYDQFAEGYSTTQSVSVSTGTPTGDYVPTTINAMDNTSNGTRSRTFVGAWHVVWSNGIYRLDGGAFRTVADTEPQPTPQGVEGATNDSNMPTATPAALGDEDSYFQVQVGDRGIAESGVMCWDSYQVALHATHLNFDSRSQAYGAYMVQVEDAHLIRSNGGVIVTLLSQPVANEPFKIGWVSNVRGQPPIQKCWLEPERAAYYITSWY